MQEIKLELEPEQEQKEHQSQPQSQPQPVHMYNGLEFTNTTERVAFIVWQLVVSGSPLSTRQLADMVGITNDGVTRSVEKISAVLPIYKDEGKWRLMTDCHLI